METKQNTIKKRAVNIKELRPSDRIFQLDRDTFLIYVGLHEDDSRPFVRVGGGTSIPEGALPHIDNVILTEKEMCNVGEEIALLRAAKRKGQKQKTRYIGSKAIVNQLYKITEAVYAADVSAKKSSIKRQDILDVGMLEMNLFGPPAKNIGKKRVTVNLMKDGNFVILVGTSRVFASSAIHKGKVDWGREYDMIVEALSKQHLFLERDDKHSFAWLDDESLDNKSRSCPFIYWNHCGSGAVVNPPHDYHYRLFEQRVNPKHVQAFLSYSGEDTGFIQGLHHKSVRSQSAMLYTANEQLGLSLKKMYPQAQVSYLVDGELVPNMPETNFFTSRTKSHAVFGWRLKPNSDRATQILFPLGGGYPSRAFNMIRSPHDVEIQIINERQDLASSVAHLVLQIPVKYPMVLFALQRLRNGRYPLVPRKEYVCHQAVDSNDLIDSVLEPFSDLPYQDFLNNFLKLHCHKDANPVILTKALKKLSKLKVPVTDFILRHNIYNYLQFIKSLPAYASHYQSGTNRRIMKWLCWKFSPVFTSYKTWLKLAKMPVEFHLIIIGGKQTLLLVKKKSEQTHQINLNEVKVPPPLDVLERDPRDYAYQLRLWERQVDRSGAEEFRSTIELLEKLYKEKLRILDERKRFKNFTQALGLDLSTLAFAESNMESALLTEEVRGINGTFGKLARHLKSIGGGIGTETLGMVLRYSPAVLLTTLLLFATIKTVGYLSGDEISPLGDSSAEIAATLLVKPGSYQSEAYVPGENDVPTSVVEISQYANVLAQKNGFARLNQANAQAQLRNPNLVFPGDELRLPDNRLSKINKGDYIWEISRVHYRKDFARIQILQRQIYAFFADSVSRLSKQQFAQVRQKQALMNRLAVTTKMRVLRAEVNKELRERF